MNKTKNRLADFGLLYAAAIWGATFFIVKKNLDQINPIILVGYRFTLSAIILSIPLLVKKIDIFKDLKKGFFLGIVLWLLYVPQTIGLKFTNAANSGFITGLFVVFVPIFSILIFKKVPSLTKVIASILSLLGLWILTGGLKQMNLGDLITLVSAAAYGLHLLMVDTYVKKTNPIVLSFQQFFCVGILSFVLGFLLKIPFTLPINSWGVISFLTIVPTLSANLIQLVAQRFTAPLKVSLILALEPVFAALFAWTLGGETPVARQALGGLIIFLSMILSEIYLPKKLFSSLY